MLKTLLWNSCIIFLYYLPFILHSFLKRKFLKKISCHQNNFISEGSFINQHTLEKFILEFRNCQKCDFYPEIPTSKTDFVSKTKARQREGYNLYLTVYHVLYHIFHLIYLILNKFDPTSGPQKVMNSKIVYYQFI